MERLRHFVCLLLSVLWTVDGTYYVKPTGRYEITEIPLPPSVIEQINKNNARSTPNPCQVTPSGVPIQTRITQIVQLPPKPAPLQPCPPPSACPCPCPPPSSSGKSLYLRPLPKTNNQSSAHCTSLCICLCISGLFPSRVSSPNPIQPSSVPNSNAVGVIPVVASPLSNRIGAAFLPSAPSASKSTPTISVTPSSISQQSANSVTCPGLTGCASSGNPVISISRTIQAGSSATPGPTLIPPMLPVAQVSDAVPAPS